MVLKLCMSQSTAHGIANIANEPHMSAKVMWALFTVVVIVGFGFHTSLLYRQWWEEQVSTSTEPNSIPFIQPDILICPERFLARDFINSPPENEFEYMLNVSKEIQRMDAWYGSIPTKAPAIIWDSLNLHRIFKAFFHRPHEFFIKIVCKSLIDIKESLHAEMNLAHLACFRITPQMCNLTSPMDSLVMVLYVHVHGENLTYDKLNVTVDGWPLDSFLFAPRSPDDEMEDGVRVYFLGRHDLISKYSRRVNASPNTHTNIKIISTRHENIATAKRKCVAEDPLQKIYDILEENISKKYLNFSRSSLCLYQNFQDIIYRFWKCLSKQLPIPVYLPHNVSFCGRSLSKKFVRMYTMVLDNSESMSPFRSKCFGINPCTYTSYSTIVNYANWPRPSSLRRLTRYHVSSKLRTLRASNLSSPGLSEMYDSIQRNSSNVLPWMRNVMKVMISPGEYMSSKVVESPSYSLKNFFSDTGGIL